MFVKRHEGLNLLAVDPAVRREALRAREGPNRFSKAETREVGPLTVLIGRNPNPPFSPQPNDAKRAL
ncbi:hypothetical protein GCM10008171_20300 [Methylopila jiangsuensis]|uniref:Uncharacterized protein n=1 Tax=Methylopila jiangsuensis TaxID=586230 RepID=A0A9W6JI05_9HYPH|nr:hypothetical protein GCM10008171_20300 [Methylopila jiangsuensis]